MPPRHPPPPPLPLVKAKVRFMYQLFDIYFFIVVESSFYGPSGLCPGETSLQLSCSFPLFPSLSEVISLSLPLLSPPLLLLLIKASSHLQFSTQILPEKS